mgnify:CR=1 FL=1
MSYTSYRSCSLNSLPLDCWWRSLPARLLRVLPGLFLLAHQPLQAMAPPPPPPASLPASRPNIVLVVADDLGYGDLGCYGQQQIRTPHLDRMAADGVRFSRFYAGAPVCAPSRAVLMTGRHTGHTAVDRNASPNIPLAPVELTFAQSLASARYFTAFIGKWGLGGATPCRNFGGTITHRHLPPGGGDALLPSALHSLPTRKGFAHSLAILDQNYAHQHFPEFIWEGESLSNITGNAGLPQSERTVYAQDLFTARALELLANADAHRPVCIVLSYLIPHRQLVDPPGENPYRDQPWPPHEAAFAAMISKLDSDVGRILAAIDAHPALASNTLVIVTSDNGPHNADGHSPHFFNSSGGLRGMKFSLYEGGIRVPCIMRWPGTIKPGSVCDVPCGFVDLAPTFRELAGLPAAQPPSDGVSLLPLLSGATRLNRTTPLLWYSPPANPSNSTVAAMLTNQWKFILHADGTPALFCLLYTSPSPRDS